MDSDFWERVWYNLEEKKLLVLLELYLAILRRVRKGDKNTILKREDFIWRIIRSYLLFLRLLAKVTICLFYLITNAHIINMEV